MEKKKYGARPEAWDLWTGLGVGKDLLPVVSNPDAQISPMSKMQGLGKTPSWYNSQGFAAGITKWTQSITTPAQIERWKAQPDYGICVQTRTLGAFDIDVEDKAKAKVARDLITDFLGPCPVRYRDGTGKVLIPFKRDFAMPKRVLHIEGGMIEILGDGQQFIAEGTHPSGTRYQWNGTELPATKVLTLERLDELCALLAMCLGTGDWKIAREKREGSGGDVAVDDDVAGWLVDNWEIHDAGDQGQLFIRCPFEGEHTSDSGPTSTAYFPAGTGGYQQGHFVCLHAHCNGRADGDFLDQVGYSASQFADLVRLDSEQKQWREGILADMGMPKS